MSDDKALDSGQSQLANTPQGVLVVLPVLNEIANIEPLLTGIRKNLEPRPFTICVIDDGSTDGTAAYVMGLQQSDSQIHLIQRTKHGRGSQRGSALHVGMTWGLRHTTHTIFVEMDGDQSHRVEELPEGVEWVASGQCDVAIASKYKPGSEVVGRPLGRRILSRICSLAVGFLLDSKIEDYSNGYRFYSRQAAQVIAEHQIAYGSPIYLSEVLAIWLRSGLRLVEFPSRYIGRDEGLSKLRIRDLVKASIAVFEIALRFHLLGFRLLDRKAGSAAVYAAAHQSAEQRAVNALCTVLVLMVGVVCFFTPREEHIDELGLFNPVYTYVHNGRMTYPVHHGYEAMIVHPPVHYGLVGTLMKFGLNSYYAAGIPPFLLTVLLVLLIRSGPFPGWCKLAFLLGPLASFLAMPGMYVSCIRPDISLALAWFAGLVALESSRLEGWNTRKLFLGGFLVTYASGIHYFAAFAWLGLLVYMFWIWKDLGRRAAKMKILAMVLGACTFGIPYLAFFVLPHFVEILTMVGFVQGGNQPGAIKYHLFLYKIMADGYREATGFWTFYAALLYSSFHLHVPLALFGPAMLWSTRWTRGIALACIPPIAFVLCCARHKSVSYFLPELMAFFSGSFALALMCVSRLAERRLPPGMAVHALPLTAAVLGLALCFGRGEIGDVKVSIRVNDHAMHLARSCAREIVGPHALVGGRIGCWYIGGADYWYDLNVNFLMKPRSSSTESREYLSTLDAVVEHTPMADWCMNEDGRTISGLYRDGVLNLKGFHLTDASDSLNFLLFDSRASKPARGYLHKGGILYSLEPSDDGDYVFASWIRPGETDVPMLKQGALRWHEIPLPGRERTDIPPAVPVSLITSAVLDSREYSQAAQHMPQTVVVRDLQRMRLTLADKSSVLARHMDDAPAIRFSPSLVELILARHNLQPLTILDPKQWECAENEVVLEPSSSRLLVTVNRENWRNAIHCSWIAPETGTYYFELTYQQEQGGLHFVAYDAQGQKELASADQVVKRPDKSRTKTFLLALKAGENILLSIVNDRPEKRRPAKFEVIEGKIFKLPGQM